MIQLQDPQHPQSLPRLPLAEEPVRALRHLPLDLDYRYWRGTSGKRYLHKIHSFAECPAFADANVIFVRREPDGARQALWIGQTSGIGGLPRRPGILKRMGELGANEVHVHLLAASQSERDAIERDLSGRRS